MVCRFCAVVLLCKHFTWTMEYTFCGHYVEHLNISKKTYNIIIWELLRRLWSAHVQFGHPFTCLQIKQLKCLILFGAIWLYCIWSHFYRFSNHDRMFANANWWPEKTHYRKTYNFAWPYMRCKAFLLHFHNYTHKRSKRLPNCRLAIEACTHGRDDCRLLGPFA